MRKVDLQSYPLLKLPISIKTFLKTTESRLRAILETETFNLQLKTAITVSHKKGKIFQGVSRDKKT